MATTEDQRLSERKQFVPDAVTVGEIASELCDLARRFPDQRDSLHRLGECLKMCGDAEVQQDGCLRIAKVATEETITQPSDHQIEDAFSIVQIAHSYIYACLGFIYGTGQGGFTDTNKAFEFYQLAAKAGVGEAQCSLGEMYYYGVNDNILKNLQSAYVWFDRAMADEVSYELNFVNSAMNWLKRKPMMYLKCKPPYQLHATKQLARMSLHEVDDTSENRRADLYSGIRLLSVAAVGGCAEAQLWLASYFLVGLGEFCDRRKALFWLRKSRKSNDTAKQVSQTVDVQTKKYEFLASCRISKISTIVQLGDNCFFL